MLVSRETDRYLSGMLNVQALLNKIFRVYCSINNWFR